MLNNIIKQQMSKSNGEVKIVKVSTSKRLSKASYTKLNEEIRSHVEANKGMSKRSWILAETSSARKTK